MQRKDFIGIFKAMDGLPVTIRLLDPPLHEFLPTEAAQFKALSAEMGLPAKTLEARAEQLHEEDRHAQHANCDDEDRQGQSFEHFARSLGLVFQSMS